MFKFIKRLFSKRRVTYEDLVESFDNSLKQSIEDYNHKLTRDEISNWKNFKDI